MTARPGRADPRQREHRTRSRRGEVANAYTSAGRTGEAVELGEQVLADRERILGPEHPDTLEARGNLAASYWSAGRTDDAFELDERVLADFERILGDDHRSTLIARGNLASLVPVGGSHRRGDRASASASSPTTSS